MGSYFRRIISPARLFQIRIIDPVFNLFIFLSITLITSGYYHGIKGGS